MIKRYHFTLLSKENLFQFCVRKSEREIVISETKYDNISNICLDGIQKFIYFDFFLFVRFE